MQEIEGGRGNGTYGGPAARREGGSSAPVGVTELRLRAIQA
jgi:hypothetical protein